MSRFGIVWQSMMSARDGIRGLDRPAARSGVVLEEYDLLNKMNASLAFTLQDPS